MPPSKTPPYARILSGRDLAELPAGPRPENPDEAWGVEFNRRRWRAILKRLILAALYSLPPAAAVRLGLHFGDAIPVWLLIGGALPVIFCLLGLAVNLGSAVIGLTWRA